MPNYNCLFNSKSTAAIQLIPRALVSLFLSFSIFTPIIVKADDGYRLEIIKSTQELRLKRGEQTIQTFHIAYGKGDNGPKRHLGDNRTPVGFYRILDFKPESKFFFFMQISYPNLLDAWHGYQDQIISSAEFKQIALAFKNHEMPPQNTKLGGYIGIHGIGEDSTTDRLLIHQSVNWTEGCIALTNEEIDILRQYVTKGTPVFIQN
ncbi:MAG: ErfK/YbiS/YcfS/YnhG family protein [Gammaproteobacteria bacterium]|nr:ErfK/YbiS/YcfS/YnhG family protein [Gammaproteobacteria bacterium]